MYVRVLIAGRLQLAREQVRLDRLCVRIIERLVPTGQEVVDLAPPVNLNGEQAPEDLLQAHAPGKPIG